MQAFVVCERAREIKEQVGAHGVLMGGDLNSDPLSGAAQMIMNGVLGQEDASYQDCWKNLHKMVWGARGGGGGGGVEGKERGGEGEEEQPPKMVLAGGGMQSVTGLPDFSN